MVQGRRRPWIPDDGQPCWPIQLSLFHRRRRLGLPSDLSTGRTTDVRNRWTIRIRAVGTRVVSNRTTSSLTLRQCGWLSDGAGEQAGRLADLERLTARGGGRRDGELDAVVVREAPRFDQHCDARRVDERQVAHVDHN